MSLPTWANWNLRGAGGHAWAQRQTLQGRAGGFHTGGRHVTTDRGRLLQVGISQGGISQGAACMHDAAAATNEAPDRNG